MMKLLKLSLCLLAATLSGQVLAQNTVKVESAWARATVQGQKATGAFMKLTAPQATRLVSVSTPVAGVAEIHEMKMEGDVMRMRALPSLALPAGQAVELRPGGYHLMLTQLKTPLKADTRVSLTLVLRDARGAERRLEVQVPLAVRAPGAAVEAPAHHGAHKH